MVVLSNQPAFTCSKSTMETPAKYVKSVQSHSGGFLVNFKQISLIVPTVDFE